jgi:hypothetical protein
MATATAVAIPTAALAGARPHPDAELLRLGRELEEAWARERATVRPAASDDEVNAVFNVASEIVGEIEALPATTLEGLRVKTRALSWCHDGEGIDFRDEQDTTDLKLANGIVRDLLALAAAHV